MSLIFCDSFDVIPEPTGWSFRDEDLKCIAQGMNQAGALAAELLKTREMLRVAHNFLTAKKELEENERTRKNDQWVLQRVRTASTMHVRRPLPDLYERCSGRDGRRDNLPELWEKAVC